MKIIRRFLPFILLGVIVFFSLGKTLQYYFYTDDYADLYHVQHNYSLGPPYDNVVPFFIPLYKLFGINALPYFSLALFTYFLASIGVYFFVKKLTGNKAIAFLSSGIFATGYIGLDHFTMIAISIIDNINIINISITLILLLFWIDTKKLRYYILTFLMFWFSMWLFSFRAFPLILFLPTLDFFVGFRLGKVTKMIKQLLFLVIRYIPFILITSRQYGFFPYLFGIGKIGDISSFTSLTNNHSQIFTILNFDFLKELFATLGSFFLIKPISNILGFVSNQSFMLMGFIFFIAIIIISFLSFKRKYSRYTQSLFAVLILSIESYIGFMVLDIHLFGNNPVNRYLTTAFLFFSAAIPLFLFLVLNKIEKWINKKKALLILIILIICNFAFLSRIYEGAIIQNRSIPAKNFFRELKAEIPNLSNDTYNIFYFDSALYYPVFSRFGSVLASALMDNSVNLAVPYKISKDSIKITNTFEEFLRLVTNPPEGRKVAYYTFYVDENGLHNTTDKVFALLKNGSFTISLYTN